MLRMQKAAFLAILFACLTSACSQAVAAQDDAEAQADPAQAPADAAPSAVEEGDAQSEEEPEQAAEGPAGIPVAAEESPEQAEGDPTETERPPPNPIENIGRARGSVVQIVVLGQNGEVKRVGSGFVAAADRVLTAAHLVLDENRIVAVPLTTRTELVARIIHWNERSGLALLAVNGLNLPALPFAKDGFASGRLVYSVGVWGASDESLLVASADGEAPLATAKGAVGERGEIPAAAGVPAVGLIQHNALIPAAGYGGPLLNECGEVAGVNRGPPGMPIWRLRRGQVPEGVVHAAEATAIAGFLQPVGIAFTQSETSCVEAREQAEVQAAAARAQAEQAEAQVAAARAQAEQARAQEEQAQTQAQQAQAQADAAARQAEEKGRELERRQQELEAASARVSDLEEQYQEAVRTGATEAESLRANLDGARSERDAAQATVAALENDLATLEARRAQEAQAERRRLIAIVIAAVVVVLLVIIFAVLAHRKRLQELAHVQQQAADAQQEAQRARAEAETPDFPDCLLTGETVEGRPVSLKMSGSLLAGDGVVVGRSPRHSTFLIDDETMSREHARFFAEGGSLFIEDLDTTNGTQIGGRQIQPRTPVALGEGELVELGAMRAQVSWEA